MNECGLLMSCQQYVQVLPVMNGLLQEFPHSLVRFIPTFTCMHTFLLKILYLTLLALSFFFFFLVNISPSEFQVCMELTFKSYAL